jgi:hypothetical protein
MGNIDEISHTIGRMESKLDHLVSSHEAIAERFEKHDERLKEIEGYKHWLMGVAAAAAVAFSLVIDFVKNRVFGGA